MSHVVDDLLVEATTAATMSVARGSVVEVIDVDGQQVADFVAFAADDFSEWLSTTHTRTALMRLKLSVGDELRTNRRRAMFRVVADDVGVHDLLIAMCDPERYEQDFGLVGHRSCRSNLTRAFSNWSLESFQIPDPLNIFQNSPVTELGEMTTVEPLSRAGQKLTLETLMDVVLGVSACPQDQNPCNGWNPSRIRVRVLSGERDNPGGVSVGG
ncbi:MAG: DUF1989 domain-containing protein [Candidatus Dormibacteria bacterium]